MNLVHVCAKQRCNSLKPAIYEANLSIQFCLSSYQYLTYTNHETSSKTHQKVRSFIEDQFCLWLNLFLSFSNFKDLSYKTNCFISVILDSTSCSRYWTLTQHMEHNFFVGYNVKSVTFFYSILPLNIPVLLGIK